MTRIRRLITWESALGLLGGIGCLAVVALVVLGVVASRQINNAIAQGFADYFRECQTHAKVRGLDNSGLPKGPVTAAFISGRPDADLVYPGATVLKRSSHDEVFCGLHLSRRPAETEIEFSTPDMPSAVNSWYEGRLASEGWRECVEYRNMPPYRGETTRIFHRGDREDYTVDHFVPVYPSPPPGNLFTVTYGIEPHTEFSVPPPWTGNCTLVSLTHP